LVAETRAAFLSELADTGPMLLAQASAGRMDEDETAQLAASIESTVLSGWAATLRGMLERIAGRIASGIHAAAAAVLQAGRLAEAVNRREWFRIVRENFGVDVLRNEPELPTLLSAWENENLGLIRSLPQRTIDELRGSFTRGLTFGTSLREMAQQVRERTDVADSKSELIARDQIGKLNGQLAQYRQTRAGVTHYVWVTMHDERVRPSHRARDGKTFPWGKMPVPGSEIRCRCNASPVFPETMTSEAVQQG
jgi:SPP1 gp7 family putative phage head morphogenesis protein